jgi:hypothetical protein
VHAVFTVLSHCVLTGCSFQPPSVSFACRRHGAEGSLEEPIPGSTEPRVNHRVLRVGKKFAHCGTCMDRGQQALVALLINAVLLWPFRKEIWIAVLLCGEGCATYAILHAQLRPAIQIVMVFLSSGGDHGRSYASTYGVNAQDWMTDLPDEDVPAGRLGVPCLKNWHASIAKNVSHMLAVHGLQGQTSYMCILECDCFNTYEFMKQAAAALNTRRRVRGVCLSCKGDMGRGLAGRLLFTPNEFWHLGGYDQDSPPSGGWIGAL